MKTWVGTITATFYQDVYVEAETKEEAELLMFDKFNLAQATCEECNAFDVQEVKEGETA